MSAERKRVLTIVIGIVVAVVVAVGARFAFFSSGSANENQANIEKAVSQVKQQIQLPKKIDEITTLEDVTAEQSTINYHYSIDGVSPSELPQSKLRESVRPSLCAQHSLADILDQGVHVKYSYVFKNAPDTYQLDFGKGDC